MKTIEVGCAIIIRENELLIAQRKFESHLGGYWEFPGGKRSDHEPFEACIQREVEEELGIQIKAHTKIHEQEHTYPEKKVKLFFYLCDWLEGKPEKKDCQDFKWVKPEELKNFKFPPGDDWVIGELVRRKDLYFKK